MTEIEITQDTECYCCGQELKVGDGGYYDKEYGAVYCCTHGELAEED
jgi:hypothetical protein